MPVFICRKPFLTYQFFADVYGAAFFMPENAFLFRQVIQAAVRQDVTAPPLFIYRFHRTQSKEV